MAEAYNKALNSQLPAANVSDLSAVKVVLKSGETLLIGTEDSANLTKKLNRQLTNASNLTSFVGTSTRWLSRRASIVNK